MLAASALEIRETLLSRLNRARAETDQLFGLVQPESLYQRPIAERHRIIFYLGHLEAFDWNLLHHRLKGRKAVRPEFGQAVSPSALTLSAMNCLQIGPKTGPL